MKPIIFIYTNSTLNKSKVIGMSDVEKGAERKLLLTGYKLTATLDSAVFIEHLLGLEKQKDIVESVRGLREI